MKFILEFGYDLKEGVAVDFQEWLKENEKELAQSMPEGVSYLGTFFTMFSSEKHAGSVRTMYQLDSYGAQDSLAAAMRDGSVFSKLIQESMSFADNRNDANGSNALLKSVVDASVWEPDAD